MTWVYLTPLQGDLWFDLIVLFLFNNIPCNEKRHSKLLTLELEVVSAIVWSWWDFCFDLINY
jgi:hypothetical protein